MSLDPTSLAVRGVALSLFLVLSHPVLAGQQRYGALGGVVSDQTGARLPGILITLTHSESDRITTLTTGAYGDYYLSPIEPGRYLIRMELPGFEIAEFPDIEVLAGQTLELDARLGISAISTAIEVTGLAPSSRPLGTAVTRTLTTEEFELLPRTRSFQGIASIVAGVHTGEIGSGIQTHGATGAENRFLIDGTSTNSLIDGGSRQNAPYEYLEQVQVTTSGLDAEFAGTPGGVVSASTRSGGNALHGEVHVYYGGSGLSADPVRRLVLDPVDDVSVGYVQDDPDRYRRLEGGFALGGPIRQDRLFFYTAWSPARTRRERDYLLDHGTQPATFEQARTFMSGFNKISFDPNPSLRTSVSMLWTPSTSEGALAAFNGFGPSWDSRSAAGLAANRERGFFAPQSSFAGTLDLFLTPRIVFGARGGYFWDNYKDTGVDPTSSVEYRTSAVGLAGVPAELQQGVGFTNTPRIVNVAHDRTSRASGNVDIAIAGDRGGFHDFKTGYGIEKSINNVGAAFAGGGYVFVFWDTVFTGSPTGVQDRGPFGYYEVHDRGTRGSAGATTQSFYVQDRWQIASGVTLSLGVRMENEHIPGFRNDVFGNPFEVAFDWTEKVAPRIGFSWDALAAGAVRIYGSYGRQHDWNKYEWVRSALGGDFWRVRYRSLDSPDVFSLSGTETPGRDLWIPSVPDSFRDLGGVDFGTGVDPDLRPMSQDEYVMGLDYRWNGETLVGIRYVHRDLVRAIEDFARIVSGSAVFTYGNPGEGLATTNQNPSTATPPFDFPRPVRTYDGLSVTVSRRPESGWFGNLSYTWSRLWGNYPGLANADEVWTPTLGFGFPTSQQQDSSIGRPGGNTSLAWDLDEILFDSRGNLDVVGRLPGDRPHALKLTAGYERDWSGLGRTGIGVFFYLASGTPLSTRVNTALRLPVFVNGRADMGRSPTLSYTDLNLGHAIEVREGHTLRFEVTLLNVFNRKTALHRFEHLNRGAGGSRDSSAMDLGAVDLFDGYDYEALIAASPDGANAFDPRYGMEDLFQPGFEGRLGVKWSF